jgi:uncharacterized protein (TIGR02265 family)
MSHGGEETSPDEAAPGWKQEMEQRLALATSQELVRGLFFNSMLGLVQKMGDPGARERCLEASGEKEFVDFFQYPVSTLIRMTYTAGHELSARHGGFDEALRRMGQQAMVDFLDSAMGKTLRHMAGQDIRTLVSSMQGMYKMTTNYGERHVVWESPMRGRLILQRNFIPCAYHEGGLRTTLDRMEARGVKVMGRQTGPVDSEYEFSWE